MKRQSEKKQSKKARVELHLCDWRPFPALVVSRGGDYVTITISKSEFDDLVELGGISVGN